MDGLDAVNEIAKACDGKITEVGILPDNSGFAIMSMPLRKDHWIYEGTKEDVLNGYVKEESYGRFNVPPMLCRMGAKDKAVLTIGQPDSDSEDAGIPVGRGLTMTKQGFADVIRTVGRYAVRCATMNGKEMDFDPDALLQNLVVGFLGYWTDDGLDHADEWANPLCGPCPASQGEGGEMENACQEAPAPGGMAEMQAAQLKQWQPDPKDVETVAQICHEANRVICTCNGDLSQPSWADAPEWQKKSAVDGVYFHLTHRHANGRDSHDRWMEVKLVDGWRFGTTKDAEAKTHPCLLPYHALPDHERIKDDVSRAIVHGYFDKKR